MLWESSRTPESRIFFIYRHEYTRQVPIVKNHPHPRRSVSRISYLVAAPRS